MKTQYVVTLMFLFVIVSSCSNRFTTVPTAKRLSCELNDSTTVQVEIQSSPVDNNFPYKNADIWGGDYLGGDTLILPKQIISSINLKVGNNNLFVPFSAYSDLGEIDSTWLEKTERGFRLNFHGGETATSYTAILDFADDRIISRKVALGEFADWVWEETKYTFLSKEWQSQM